MNQYEARQIGGLWAVVNVETGQIAQVNDQWLELMDMDDADDMADLLNTMSADMPAAGH